MNSHQRRKNLRALRVKFPIGTKVIWRCNLDRSSDYDWYVCRYDRSPHIVWVRRLVSDGDGGINIDYQYTYPARIHALRKDT